MNNNLLKGTLKRWNDDKGFGFIGSEHGRRDIFIHISALKRMSRRPIVGDVITYQVHKDNDGKQRAVNARIEGVAEVKYGSGRKYAKQPKQSNWIAKEVISIVMLIAIGSIAFMQYAKTSDRHENVTTTLSSYAIEEQNENSYSCAGKIYCSEMTSCGEAKFYQRNCPGTKMDGDGDGIPCESQWCGW